MDYSTVTITKKQQNYKNAVAMLTMIRRHRQISDSNTDEINTR